MSLLFACTVSTHAPGEAIDPMRFKELADLLRVVLKGPRPARCGR